MTEGQTWKYRTPVVIGAVAMVLLVGGIGTWSTQVEIAGAVLGRGSVQVEDSKVAIQHPTGGVIEDIRVSNGDLVEAGELLVRLDGTALRAELNTVDGELIEVLAQKARLEAVVDDQLKLTVDGFLADRAATDPVANLTIARHARLMEAGTAEAQRKSDLLQRKIAQVEKQIDAVDAQIEALDEQRDLLAIDMENAERMVAQKLVKSSHFTGIRQQNARLVGDAGRLRANRAELSEKMIQYQLERLAIPADRRRRAVEELGKLQPTKIKLAEKRIDLVARLDRLEIRAPVTGRVHESTVAGLRSVVTEGKPLMWIVPTDRPAVALVRIDAGDIDQVRHGQETMLRFSSFNHRATPLVPGQVLSVSADALKDPTTRSSYYEISVGFSREDLQRLLGADPVPGMPLDAFFATEKQTPFAYVTRPLVEYFNKAYRDT